VHVLGLRCPVIVHALQVVDKDGTILEKAQDEADATRMLTMLAGCTHQVHTGASTPSLLLTVSDGINIYH
jgi:predicted house-cleaning NTP pyrophosphatase (Maf/HAM1 superfamily)